MAKYHTIQTPYSVTSVNKKHFQAVINGLEGTTLDNAKITKHYRRRKGLCLGNGTELVLHLSNFKRIRIQGAMHKSFDR